jgi:large subunit ribosomal protein L22
MSKTKNDRRYDENHAFAIARGLKVSPRKIGLVAQMIRGMSIYRALEALTTSKKRISGDVKKILFSAVSNAENNHGLSVEKLYVSEAYVGKDFVLKRFLPMAKGRGAKIMKRFSNITIVVKERSAV